MAQVQAPPMQQVLAGKKFTPPVRGEALAFRAETLRIGPIFSP
jgi:hypothetical protein